LISYERAPDVEERAKKIIEVLHLEHIDQNRIHFFRSKGSKARRVQARIHGLGRIWFGALNISPNYVIEVLSEEFDKLGDIEREKVIIHELMHIPSGFSGGFVPHRGKINRKTVDALHKRYSNALSQ
jgi:predicted metallopeptidase